MTCQAIPQSLKSFDPSPYHATKLAEARRTLARYESLSEYDAYTEANKETADAEEHRKQSLKENRETIARYQDMLYLAKEWASPTEDHVKLKEFMIDQLEQSIRFDDSTEWLAKPTPVQSIKEWLEGKKLRALKDIEYHTQKYSEELKRTEDRNNWLHALRESLK